MKKYIAYGENGKNKHFDTQQELRSYFELTNKGFTDAIYKGKEVVDPDTQETYYIDELPEDE